MIDPTSAGHGPGSTWAAPVKSIERHRIEFTGSGSEYFRIWIVNLLLIVLTAGIYFPWAKVRKLKYFYGNTHIASHALDFHGTPSQMLKGYFLMGAIFAVYSIAGEASSTAGTIAGVALAAAWPALIAASLRFRLANTSWRGLRFHFTGTTKGAYTALAKPLVAALVGGGIAAFLTAQESVVSHIAAGLLAFCLYVGLTPYVYYAFKRYQHENYAYAQLQTQFRASSAEVMKIFVKTGGAVLLGAIGLLVIGGVFIGLFKVFGADKATASQLTKAAAPLFLLGFVFLQVMPVPYFQAHMQNLIWSQTGTPLVRFKSDLGFWPLFRQYLLNWVLIVITFGLYWPFAAIALARLKLQAITLHMRVDPDTLIAQMQAKGGMGVGEAAADLAGIDIGI